jgi:hypothetical protein
MFSDRVISDGGLAAISDGFRVTIRPNWYRGVPLAWIQALELKIDGEAIEPGKIMLAVNDGEFPLSSLHELANEFWFVADSATLIVRNSTAVRAGEKHQVEVLLSLRLPYIIVGDDEFLVSSDRCVKELVAAEGSA